ncbi:hypothetical protein J2W47_000080 [Priestia megaterium]|nr:hypothetical protein [Priestia megaterium]
MIVKRIICKIKEDQQDSLLYYVVYSYQISPLL